MPALEHLAASLERKRDEWATVVKSGRTHLMDATPVTLGQEFGGYAAQIEQSIERIEAVIPREDTSQDSAGSPITADFDRADQGVHAYL